MTFLLASIFSGLGSFRLHTVILWTLVVMALFNSVIERDQAWGVYHYYVGAKYFKELGYDDLYECTITQATTRRDLHTYNFRFDAPDCQASFTEERYQEFQQDIKAVGFYPGVLRDKGFNATPSWIVFAELLIESGIATPQNVGVFDVIALTIAVIFLIRFTGWTTSGYVLLFALTFYGTQDRMWGHFGQWVWLGAVAAGVALLQKNRQWGGFWIGIATGLAIFPVFLMLRYWRNQRTMVMFVGGLMLMLIMGLFTSRGFGVYGEFLSNMKMHSDYVQTELCCNIGLKHTMTWTANPDLDYRNCFAGYGECKASYPHDIPRVYWLLLPLVLTTPLGAMFGIVTLSRYYYLILGVIPIWYGEKWGRALLMVNAIIMGWMIVDNQSGFILNAWLWFGFFIVLGAKDAFQVLSTAMVHKKQGVHPQVAPGHVSQ
jgi:hypothetical protein